MRIPVWVLVFTATLTIAADPAADKALERLQGKWEIVEARERGEPADPDKVKRLPVTFSGNQMEMIYEGQKSVKWATTVRPEKDPKELDATLPREQGGKTIRGIYRFEDGVLRIALGLDKDSTRPQKFESTGGEKPTLVLVLRKSK